MKLWILKAIVQKITSFMPFKHKINYLFQKFITKAVYLDDQYFYDRLNSGAMHLKSYSEFTNLDFPDVCLEIGTGWYPVVPIANFLSGANVIYSVDISFLTSKDRIRIALEKFFIAEKTGKLKELIRIKEERMDELHAIYEEFDTLSLDGILERLRIVYKVEDARSLSLPDDSIDLVHSNNTFEHIYPDILVPILAEFKRVVKKKNGIMSHGIDMTDHFANLDKSITCFNFLRFSDSKWRFIDNSIQPQSRLRYNEYVDIYERLSIPISKHECVKGKIEDLQSISLNSKYAGLTQDQLLIVGCRFISWFN